jgi:hypothetical protein
LKKEFEAVFPTSVSENVLSKNEANKKSRDRKSLVIFTADGNDDVDDIGNPPDTTGLGEENTFSIDSSSIDWSPPESHLVSRRSTLFGASMIIYKMNQLIEKCRISLAIDHRDFTDNCSYSY